MMGVGDPDLEGMAMSEVDEQDDESPEEDTEAVTRKKQERVTELKAELAELEGEEDSAAEEIAEGDPSSEEIDEESQAAAEEIATELKSSQRVTLTDKEIDGIATRIAKRTREKMNEQPETPSMGTPSATRSAVRQRDKPPRPTHFSQRVIGGRKR